MFGALFTIVLMALKGFVAVLVVPLGVDTETLVIWIVLIEVTGPEGLSVTTVLREAEVMV